MTEPGFTILHADAFEKSGDWLLARRSLGLSAFGMNLVEIRPGGRIPEHDETEPRPGGGLRRAARGGRRS